MEVFEEKQVYRIDHYIWKEAVQNILAFRFTNSIFESIWNNKYIDNVQITASESIWVWDRWWYYDKFWALKDMLQNHLLQVLSLVVMDYPSKLDAKWIMQEKLRVFRAINLWNNFEENVVFWQYKWYLSEKWVEKNSTTDTFVAMKLEVATYNFIWVPIYLRTWKYMKEKSTKIVIEFKEVPKILFNENWKLEKNRIILEVQPSESIDIHFNIKQNWTSKDIKRVRSVFSKEIGSKEAYQKLIEDIISSDKTLFTSWNMLEETWRIVDKLVNCKSNCTKINKYNKWDNWPIKSYNLLKNDNRSWYE